MIDIKDMFSCGVHYGHRTAYSDPKMAQYVFTQKNDLQIIDLRQTAHLFSEALAFIDQLVRSGGRIVIVGTKQAAQELVQKYGMDMEMPYVDQRWYAGTLTNFKTIRSSVDRLSDLEKRFKVADFKGLTKKEKLVLHRERAKLTVSLGGVQNLNTLPEALFVIDVAQEKIAVREANKLGIPVVGIVDTNCSPEGINYIIPGNDDAMSAIEYYLDCITQVVKAAQVELRAAQAKNEKRNMPIIKQTSAKDKVAEQVKVASKVVAEIIDDADEDSDSIAVKQVVKKVVKKVRKVSAESSMLEDDRPSDKTAKKPMMKTVKKVVKPETSVKKVTKAPVKKKPVVKSGGKPSAKE